MVVSYQQDSFLVSQLMDTCCILYTVRRCTTESFKASPFIWTAIPNSMSTDHVIDWHTIAWSVLYCGSFEILGVPEEGLDGEHLPNLFWSDCINCGSIELVFSKWQAGGTWSETLSWNNQFYKYNTNNKKAEKIDSTNLTWALPSIMVPYAWDFDGWKEVVLSKQAVLMRMDLKTNLWEIIIRLWTLPALSWLRALEISLRTSFKSFIAFFRLLLSLLSLFLILIFFLFLIFFNFFKLII